MTIVDTNVISELMRPVPDPQVLAWLSQQNPAAVYFTAVGEAELRYGVALLPAGRRRNAIAAAIESILAEDFRHRILPFDRTAAASYAIIAANRRAAGRPISHFDCQIAAIAHAHNAAVATRNTSDFEGVGLPIVNPWQSSATPIH